jgi:hypothetical protein
MATTSHSTGSKAAAPAAAKAKGGKIGTAPAGTPASAPSVMTAARTSAPHGLPSQRAQLGNVPQHRLIVGPAAPRLSRASSSPRANVRAHQLTRDGAHGGGA